MGADPRVNRPWAGLRHWIGDRRTTAAVAHQPGAMLQVVGTGLPHSVKTHPQTFHNPLGFLKHIDTTHG